MSDTLKDHFRKQLQDELPNLTPEQIDSLMKMAEEAGRRIAAEEPEVCPYDCDGCHSSDCPCDRMGCAGSGVTYQ